MNSDSRKYISHGAGLVYHVTFQEVQKGSKQHGAVKELTSEHQRFNWTEILYSLRKNGGYIRSSLGGRFVLVVRQTGWLSDEKLIVYIIFKIL